MLRVAISVIENIANTCGTTVRARAIWEILKNNYKVLLITRATSLNNKFSKYLKTGNEVKLVKPDGTKLWNLKLVPIILNYRFHCVYCVADIFGFFTYYLLSKFLRYKIIFEAHALVYKEAEQVSKVKSFIYLLLETFIGKKANAVIALSLVTYNFYKRLNQYTFFIPVFIDLKRFKKKEKVIKSVARVDTEKIVGLVGPFDILPNRYQLNFLYSNLDKFDRRIRFKIIGKCDRRIANDKIEYTGYLKSFKEYTEELCKIDALLVPVKFATYGPKNKILEAMACGVPVFATWEAVIGLDFAENFKNIIVSNESQLINVLNKLIFDEKCMKEIGLNARNTVIKSYNVDLYIDKILHILFEVLRSK